MHDNQDYRNVLLSPPEKLSSSPSQKLANNYCG